MDSTSCKRKIHNCFKGNTAHALDMVETKNVSNSELLFLWELVLYNKGDIDCISNAYWGTGGTSSTMLNESPLSQRVLEICFQKMVLEQRAYMYM